ncbi:hypothetical protein [Ekhidna sp.]|uniref:hypothetical protein n=1 Tax=Ekhidna sp. TaxID=2608089 RepID=UPI0032EE4F8C
MNIRFILVLSIFGLLIASRFRLYRAAHMEMYEAKGIEVNYSVIDLDEFWPFPETISKADPYIGELEKKLAKNNEEISL